MINVDEIAGFARDANRFGQFLEAINIFAAYVDTTIASETANDFCHLDNLVRILRPLRVPCRSKAQRPLFHRLRHETIHLLLLGAIRRPLIKTHYHTFYLLRRYTRRDVNRYAVFHYAVKVSGERLPIGFDAVAAPMLQ